MRYKSTLNADMYLLVKPRGGLFPSTFINVSLYNTIISKLRSEKKIVLPVASSGIAALLLPFGGKTVLLGGDFRQTLPIIPQGSRADAVLASIKQSHLWDFCNVFDLKQNMRLDESQESFAEWLLSVGDGAAPYISSVQGLINHTKPKHQRQAFPGKLLRPRQSEAMQGDKEWKDRRKTSAMQH